MSPELSHMKFWALIVNQNHALDAWFGKNYIVEAEICPDHVHMLVEIPPKISVSSFMGYLKGKSSTILYEQFGELKYKYSVVRQIKWRKKLQIKSGIKM